MCASDVDRQAAAIVRKVLAAHATGRKGVSVKGLCLADHVRAKTAVYAVVCNTLAHVQPLSAVRQETGLATDHPELEEGAALVLLYELLLGQGFRQQGPAEQLVTSLSAAAQRTFATQAPAAQSAADRQPRCVRINLLKTSQQSGMELLRSMAGDAAADELQDPLLPDVALLPPGGDHHSHPAVQDGRLVLQVRLCCCWPWRCGCHDLR